MVNIFYNQFRVIFFVAIFFYSTIIQAAIITATVDRNPIPIGESFRLIVDVRGSVSDEPDFSELQKHFKILNQSQSSNFRYVNGAITRNKTWTLMLIAEKVGPVTIAPIKVGSDSSDEIRLNIIASSVNNKSAQTRDIYLEIELEPKSVYVQQQIIYTVKLFRNIRISNATLSDPNIENDQAIVSKVGKDRNYNTTINGIAYTVFERRYAIFPQKSGRLKIAPITFETEVVRGSRSIFNMAPFSQNSVKRIKSRATTIEVKGIPEEFSKKYPTSSWLPVHQLEIQESWSSDINSLKVGEPITRTITLAAQNLSAAQLPNINFESTQGIKIYPDKAEVAENENKSGLISSKIFKSALLATKAGQFKLPEIKIPWWNTLNNEISVLSIPAQTIRVSGVAVIDNNTTPQENDSVMVDTRTTMANAITSPNIDKLSVVNHPIWILTSIVFALLWLMTLWLLYRSKVRQSSADHEPAQTSNTTVSKRQIKQACKSNNAVSASQAILKWANQYNTQDRFDNLSSLLPYVNDSLYACIQDLEHKLYSQKSREWLGRELWSAFKSNPPQFDSEPNTHATEPKLTALYAKYD